MGVIRWLSIGTVESGLAAYPRAGFLNPHLTPCTHPRPLHQPPSCIRRGSLEALLDCARCFTRAQGVSCADVCRPLYQYAQESCPRHPVAAVLQQAASIYWLPAQCLINGPTDCPTEWSTDQPLTAWLPAWLAGCLPARLAGRLAGCLTDQSSVLPEGLRVTAWGAPQATCPPRLLAPRRTPCLRRPLLKQIPVPFPATCAVAGTAAAHPATEGGGDWYKARCVRGAICACVWLCAGSLRLPQRAAAAWAAIFEGRMGQGRPTGRRSQRMQPCMARGDAASNWDHPVTADCKQHAPHAAPGQCNNPLTPELDTTVLESTPRPYPYTL
jgi:hypothetical protein